jgi:uncharacterized protein (DUF2141 family)
MIGQIAAEPSHDLTVVISGGIPRTGQVLVTLFNSSQSYMRESHREEQAPVDDGGRSTMVFVALPATDYAVSVVYDRDSDGELDTNFVGIPTEAFGFSNNATAFFGPPDWDAARFALQGDLTIEIELETTE